MQDKIEKRIHLEASVSRVWRAISDYKEFGQWFMVRIEEPFKVGCISRGQFIHPGCKHLKWDVKIEAMEKEKLLSLSWCPYSDGDMSYSGSPHTLVEFRLEPTKDGTNVVITESGFSDLPQDGRCREAFRLNGLGWDAQAENLLNHVAT